MQALGLIETKGLLAAIEAADIMVKSSDVSIIQKTYVGAGLVTILVTGDVGAVKAAVEAGVAAVKNLDEEFLVSEHIIPRPHEELESIIRPNTEPKVLKNSSSNEYIGDTKNIKDVENLKDTEKIEKAASNIDLDELHKLDLENLHKEDVDNLVKKNGIENTILILNKLKVVKLRNLAREYKDFVIKGRIISKADKNLLISKFKLYYEKN